MNFPAALPQVQAGTLRALAQTGLTRASSAPDIPTLVEPRFPGFEAAPWFGLFAPKGTPDGVIATIERAMANAMAEPEFRAKLVAIASNSTRLGRQDSLPTLLRPRSRAWQKSCGPHECCSNPELMRKAGLARLRLPALNSGAHSRQRSQSCSRSGSWPDAFNALHRGSSAV